VSCKNGIKLKGRLFLSMFLVLVPIIVRADPPISGNYVFMQTPHAQIVYHPTDEELAKTTGEAFEFSYRMVEEDLGLPNGSLTIYIYNSSEEMVNGLMTILGYDRKKATLLAKIGVSPSTKHTMHINSKAKAWGPFFWHILAHEYTHGLTEEKYGMKLTSSARWLYEGLESMKGIVL
jgi:hypothetical protein